MPVVDPFNDPEWQIYRRKVITELVPMIDDSACTMAVIPPDGTKTDVEFAVQLGFMVMLDKPILALVEPGSKVPNKLAQIADEIVEGRPGQPDFEERFKAAMSRINAKLEKES